MKSFDKFLKSILKLKISKLFISYLEGKKSLSHPTVSDILKFKNEIIPKCIKLLKSTNSKYVNNNVLNLKKLFDIGVSYKNISNGEYNHNYFKGCKNSYSMALILANGDVHPCNAVEYFHKPVVGNLKKNSLIEIWKSKKWEKIRKNGVGWCKWCPMNYHTKLVLEVSK